MRKLEISDVEIMRIAVQQEIARSEESRYDHRLHGILLVSHGINSYQVAEWLGQDPRTIQRWVTRFERQGFAGLQEGERDGRPSKLNETQWKAIGRELRINPREMGYSQNLWDGKLLSHHLAKIYGVDLGVRQCQRIFRQMGFRLRKPRPVIAKADPEAQAAYKKIAPIRQK
jgi:transposase